MGMHVIGLPTLFVDGASRGRAACDLLVQAQEPPRPAPPRAAAAGEVEAAGGQVEAAGGGAWREPPPPN